jgi:hypothetical protein
VKEFLKKIKLIDSLTINLPLSKTDFVERLSSIVDDGSVGIFPSPLELFSSSKNEYVGKVKSDGFRIRRKGRFGDTNQNISVAKGTLSEQNGQLTIETEINGFNIFLAFFMVLMLIFFSVIFIVTLTNPRNNNGLFECIFLIIPFSIMFLLPYMLLRSSVKKMKRELEREFFFLTKNN